MPKTGVAVVVSQRRIQICLVALCALTAQFGIAATPAFAQATDLPAGPLGLQLDPVVVAGQGPNYVELGAGSYALIGHHQQNQTGGADVEFKFGDKFYYLGPALGVIADLDGGGMIDATVYADLNIGSIVVTPMGGIGADWQGNRSDEPLGGPFQFRLSLEAAYQFGDRSRIGLRAGHISSGGINQHNPGENDLMLTYSIPLTL